MIYKLGHIIKTTKNILKTPNNLFDMEIIRRKKSTCVKNGVVSHRIMLHQLRLKIHDHV